MRFSHTADCHVGGHRDPRLRKLTESAFEQFVTESINAEINFVLIAGDLFNTAIPGIDALKFVVTQLSRFKKREIPVYAIPGSHDFSPSGKTMLEVLERAGLLHNVFRGQVEDGKLKLEFTNDKTGVKLTGILGKRGMLDRQLYEDLDRSIENESGDKIFLFHTAITELMSGNMHMESQPISFLPKNFKYYAGGHIHQEKHYTGQGYNVVYPGPLFPNSFSELEELQGGYYIYDDGAIVRKEITLKKTIPITLSVEGLSSHEANRKLKDIVPEDVEDAIVLLRIQGELSDGSPKDIEIRNVVNVLEERGAYAVLRNTAKLSAVTFESAERSHTEPKDIERVMLDENKDQLQLQNADGVELARILLRLLAREQKEGEKLYEYKDEILKDTLEQLDRI